MELTTRKFCLWMKGVFPYHYARLIKDLFWCHLESISLEVQRCFFEILVSSFPREIEWPLQFRKYRGWGFRIADNAIHNEIIFLTGEWWYELKNPENNWEPFGCIAPLECGLWVEKATLHRTEGVQRMQPELPIAKTWNTIHLQISQAFQSPPGIYILF